MHEALFGLTNVTVQIENIQYALLADASLATVTEMQKRFEKYLNMSTKSKEPGKAVNLSLTLRNWLIGFYITVYEQNGMDRAKYGARLLENLSSRLAEGAMDGVASRSLRQYRQFYSVYPEIWQTPSAKTIERLIPTSIWRTLSAKSQTSPPI